MSYHTSCQIEGVSETNTLENLKFPIHGEVMGRTKDTYASHACTYNQYY